MFAEKLVKFFREAEKRALKRALKLSTMFSPGGKNQAFSVPLSEAFTKPVDTSIFTTYLDVVEVPMDLSTMRNGVGEGKYDRLDGLLRFVEDASLIYTNCCAFNVDPDSRSLCLCAELVRDILHTMLRAFIRLAIELLGDQLPLDILDPNDPRMQAFLDEPDPQSMVTFLLRNPRQTIESEMPSSVLAMLGLKPSPATDAAIKNACETRSVGGHDALLEWEIIFAEFLGSYNAEPVAKAPARPKAPTSKATTASSTSTQSSVTTPTTTLTEDTVTTSSGRKSTKRNLDPWEETKPVTTLKRSASSSSSKPLTSWDELVENDTATPAPSRQLSDDGGDDEMLVFTNTGRGGKTSAKRSSSTTVDETSRKGSRTTKKAPEELIEPIEITPSTSAASGGADLGWEDILDAPVPTEEPAKARRATGTKRKARDDDEEYETAKRPPVRRRKQSGRAGDFIDADLMAEEMEGADDHTDAYIDEAFVGEGEQAIYTEALPRSIMDPNRFAIDGIAETDSFLESRGLAIPVEEWRQSADLFLAKIKKHPYVDPTKVTTVTTDFINPVIEVHPNLRDSYLQLITLPMDFRTVDTLLEEGVVTSVHHLYGLVLLIFMNAIRYNGQHTDDIIISRMVNKWHYLLQYVRWLALETLPLVDDSNLTSEECELVGDLRISMQIKARDERIELLDKIDLDEAPNPWKEFSKLITTVCRPSKKADQVRWFTYPLSNSIPDYKTIIHHPMDLATLQFRMDGTILPIKDLDIDRNQPRYQHFGEFIKDFRRIFQNAIRYNGQFLASDTTGISQQVYDAAQMFGVRLESYLPEATLQSLDRLTVLQVITAERLEDENLMYEPEPLLEDVRVRRRSTSNAAVPSISQEERVAAVLKVETKKLVELKEEHRNLLAASSNASAAIAAAAAASVTVTLPAPTTKSLAISISTSAISPPSITVNSSGIVPPADLSDGHSSPEIDPVAAPIQEVKTIVRPAQLPLLYGFGPLGQVPKRLQHLIPRKVAMLKSAWDAFPEDRM